MSFATASEPSAAPHLAIRMVCAVVLGALVLFGYGGVLDSYFLADDFNVLNIVAQAETFRDGTAVDTGWEYFRPLTALSFWFNYLWFGAETATSFHVFAVMMHWLNALLVVRLTGRVCSQWHGAWFAGAAFAVMPIHPECITWISARADVLCAAGVLLLLTGWLDYLHRRRGLWAAAEVFVGLVFALLTKDSAMILPAILIALALVYRGRSASELVGMLAAVVAVLAAYLYARISVLGGFVGSQSANDAHHLTIHWGNAIEFAIDAMRAMLLPGPPGIQSGLCLVLLLYMAVRHPDLKSFFKVTWPLVLVFLFLLAPVANAVVLGLADGTNTRFLYIPSTVFCVGLGVLLSTGLERGVKGKAAASRGAWFLRVAACVVVAIYTVNLRRVNNPWAEASAISQGIVTQLQEFTRGKDHEWVFIHGLPDTHKGAYVFRNGIDTAIKLFVSEDLVFPPHGNLSLQDWLERSAQRRRDPSAYPEILLLRWDSATRRLVEP